jgi:uridine kinase
MDDLPLTGDVTVAQVAERVTSAPARLGPVRLVCIDGPAGSGKTTLASLLGDALGAQVVHMDDLFEGWGGLSGAWPRLRDWVLAPLARGESGRYRRYDWAAGQYAEWHDVPVQGALVVEGCGSAAREVDTWASVVIWVEAPRPLRVARGIARDGEAVLENWMAWMAQEDEVFAREGTRERARLHVDAYGRITP